MLQITRSTLADQTVEAVLALIEERGLKENDVLPSTGDLAIILGVSRTTIREAIAELSGYGLLDRRQGRETIIRLPNSKQFEHMLQLRFAINGQDYEGLQEFRQIIEVGNARLAAERVTSQGLAAIENQLELMKSATTEDERHHADQAFHREIALASGNDLSTLILDGVTPILFQLRRRAWMGWKKSGKDEHPLVIAHARILAKILARDADGAALAMAEHLDQATEGLKYINNS